MGAKLVIALAAVCIAVILVSTVFIGLFFSANIGKIENSIQTQTNSVNNQQAPLLVPIIHKPGINATAIILSVTAEDNRIYQPYNLQLRGFINNTGDNTIYNGFLEIVAFNKQGIAVINNYPFEMTGHASLGIGIQLEYSGSPILNCSITPVVEEPLSPEVFNSTFP